ncbi:MAG: DedA family protein [Pseudolabrys sp.]|nr:DedA family protein [Pseudolabrys sp.]MBV9260975.1 DedA family protein [Pseudolabrys sp.]
MLESFGMPLPGESLLVFAAIMAGRGKLSFPVLLFAAWAGAVVGDNIGYWIGHSVGNTFITRYGARIGLTQARLTKVEAVFRKYGVITVAFARFVNVLRQLNGIVAGTLEMHWWTFVIFNAVGGALWVAVWAGSGFYFGRHGSGIAEFAREFAIDGAIAGAIVVAVFVALAIRFRGRR